MAEKQLHGWESDIQFVLEVQKRPCLYDTSSKGYRDPISRQRAWQEIAGIERLSASDCHTRWKTIRDRYVRTYRRNGPPGANGVIEDPTWIVSNYLSFLNPCIKPRRTTRNFTEFLEDLESPRASQSELPVYEDTDVQSNTVQDKQPVVIPESSPTAENSPDCNLLSAANTPQSSSNSDIPTDTAVTLGKRRLVHQNTIEKVLEALKAPIVLPASPQGALSLKERDADELFLLSLLPDFKGLQPQEKTRVKIKILQLIQDAQGLQPTQ